MAQYSFCRKLARLALGIAALVVGTLACTDDEDVLVRAPPPPSPPPGYAPVQGLAGAGMMIHSAVNGGLCFDAAGDRATPHTPVRLFRCHGRENQRWSFQPGARGAVTITGIAGMCLDVHGERSANGASAQLYGCHAGGNQQFTFDANGRLRELSTGKCLTAAAMADGAPIIVEPCDTRVPEQLWTIADR